MKKLIGAICLLLLALPAHAASLYSQPKYAAILVNAGTGEVLYSRRADMLRPPASITKVMTLYLAFEAIEAGELKLTDRVTISRHAAAQAPTKLGLPVGSSISVDEAIRVIAIKSANDIAVALAEKIGGSEAAFARMMTRKANQIGMRNTVFANASGLPNPALLTTARDIATMSAALIRHFPQYYGYFSQRQFTVGRQQLTSHNRLLGKSEGVDGIKTGYTVASGFTLTASALRNGRRLIAVVLGGPTSKARDENVAALLDAGFEVLERRSLGQRITVAASLNEPNEHPSFPNEVPTGQGSSN